MKNFYKNKKILVTGHTGFKGVWLCSWLLSLGAKVYGYSKNIPTQPAMYSLAGIEKHIESYTGDLLDTDFLSKTISKIKPDIIFHLAAQPITSLAYQNPLQTFEINTLGAASLLEAFRKLEQNCTLVCITSDKSYLNKEWVWGYRETDEIGGRDPYSASKAGAEIIIQSYFHTYLSKDNSKRIGIARAGNIIGGGDWGHNRIIPDCIRAWKNDQEVVIRSPKSVRPWQHIIEPIYGYLLLGMNLSTNHKINGEAFNFGPNAMDFQDVETIVSSFSNLMKKKGVNALIQVIENSDFKEARLLKLNCEKALTLLNWKPIFDIEDMLEYTASWYFEGYWNNTAILPLTQRQIAKFENRLTQPKRHEDA